MIHWLSTLIGLLMVAAGARRGEGQVGSAAISVFGLFTVLHGLGFLLRPTQAIVPQTPYLIGFLWMFACLRAGKGPAMLCATIAEIGLIVFIIMGSFG